MDQPIFKTLRIAPTTQQGGTQTIQQSIYLTHNNPCGANLLIFQEMGLTGIRYIDLKNYVDEILASEEMIILFQQVREMGTIYIQEPDNAQKTYAYLYAIQQWAQASLNNLPLPVDYYPGYRFRINVYDASGTVFYDSFAPNVKIVAIDPLTELYTLGVVKILPSNPYYNIDRTSVYKISTNYSQVPFIDIVAEPSGIFMWGFAVILSNFSVNQASCPETVMAISSLLVDSANTRAFGIPKYGFSARSNLSGFGGIGYNCAHFVDIRTATDIAGNNTLIESIFFRLSLEEDTYNFTLEDPNFSIEMKHSFLSKYFQGDIESMKNIARDLKLMTKQQESAQVEEEQSAHV